MEYEIIENIATVERNYGKTLELNYMRWYDNPPSYDLRIWNGETPLKGVSMSLDELEAIIEAFQDESGDGEEEIDFRDFFIYTDTFGCAHDLEHITAYIPVLMNGIVNDREIDAYHCSECGLYYIMEKDFYNIKYSGGIILCKIMSLQEYKEYKRQLQYGELQAQSELKMIGYNVNAKDDLSEKTRRVILQSALDERVLTKDRIKSYIKYFIMLNEKDKHKERAIRKWRSDLAWLDGANISAERKVGVKRIVRD